MAPRKELHYFNELGHRPLKPRCALTTRGTYVSATSCDGSALNVARPDGLGQLFDAKRSILSGDITPAYCMLPDEIIEMVMRKFPELKVIFLARDPVERAWSQISMSVRKGGEGAFRRQRSR